MSPAAANNPFTHGFLDGMPNLTLNIAMLRDGELIVRGCVATRDSCHP